MTSPITELDPEQFPIEPPWAQQPGEPVAAYGQFKAYLALPPGQRTVSKAYKNYIKERRGREVEKVDSAPFIMAKTWKWRERAQLYDAFQMRKADEKWVDRELELREKMFMAGNELYAKAMEALKRLDAEQIPVTSIPRFLEVAIQLMQNAQPGLDKEAITNLVRSLPPERRRRVLTIMLGKLVEYGD